MWSPRLKKCVCGGVFLAPPWEVRGSGGCQRPMEASGLRDYSTTSCMKLSFEKQVRYFFTHLVGSKSKDGILWHKVMITGYNFSFSTMMLAAAPQLRCGWMVRTPRKLSAQLNCTSWFGPEPTLATLGCHQTNLYVAYFGAVPIGPQFYHMYLWFTM